MPRSLLKPKHAHREAPRCSAILCYVLSICLAASVAAPPVLAKSKKGGYATGVLNPLFEEPSDTDLLIGLGMTALTTIAIPALSGASFSGALTSFGVGAMTGQLAQTATNLGVHAFGWDPGTSQILGYATAGALTGAVTNYASFSGGVNGLGSSLGSFGSGSSIAYDALMGGAKGALIGASTLGTYELLKDTSFYRNNPVIAGQLANLAGGTIGHLGFAAFSDLVENSTTSRINGETLSTTDYAKAYPDTWGGAMPNLRMAFWDQGFQSHVLSTGLSLGVQTLFDQDSRYSTLLGKAVAPLGATALTGGSWSQLGQAAVGGALEGMASYALESLGGKFDPATGKNRWGLTRLQMAGVNFLGTSILKSPLAGLQSPEGFWTGVGQSLAGDWQQLATSYTTFGKTSPFFTGGDRGFLQTQHILKLTEFSGLSTLAADADRLMAQTGQSWKDLVKSGDVSQLFPSTGAMLVNYGASTLHSAAAANVTALLSHTAGAATRWFISPPTMTQPHAALPEADHALLAFLHDGERLGVPPPRFGDLEPFGPRFSSDLTTPATEAPSSSPPAPSPIEPQIPSISPHARQLVLDPGLQSWHLPPVAAGALPDLGALRQDALSLPAADAEPPPAPRASDSPSFSIDPGLQSWAWRSPTGGGPGAGSLDPRDVLASAESGPEAESLTEAPLPIPTALDDPLSLDALETRRDQALAELALGRLEPSMRSSTAGGFASIPSMPEHGSLSEPIHPPMSGFKQEIPTSDPLSLEAMEARRTQALAEHALRRLETLPASEPLESNASREMAPVAPTTLPLDELTEPAMPLTPALESPESTVLPQPHGLPGPSSQFPSTPPLDLDPWGQSWYFRSPTAGGPLPSLERFRQAEPLLITAAETHTGLTPKQEDRLSQHVGSYQRQLGQHRRTGTLQRTFFGRLDDSNNLLNSLQTDPALAELQLPPVGALIDIGPGLGNRGMANRTPQAGITSIESAQQLAGVTVYALDLPEEVDKLKRTLSRNASLRSHFDRERLYYIGGDGLEALKPQLEGRSDALFADRTMPALDPEKTVVVRAANSIGTYFGWDVVQPWLMGMAKEFEDQAAILLLDESILVKTAGDPRWTLVGQLNERGFNHRSRDLTSHGAPYTLHPEALQLVGIRQEQANRQRLGELGMSTSGMEREGSAPTVVGPVDVVSESLTGQPSGTSPLLSDGSGLTSEILGSGLVSPSVHLNSNMPSAAIPTNGASPLPQASDLFEQAERSASHEQAVALYETILQLPLKAPERQWAYQNMAERHLALGQVDQAAVLLEQRIAETVGQIAAGADRPLSLADQYQHLGLSLREAGRFDEAVNVFHRGQEALQQYPGFVEEFTDFIQATEQLKAVHVQRGAQMREETALQP